MKQEGARRQAGTLPPFDIVSTHAPNTPAATHASSKRAAANQAAANAAAASTAARQAATSTATNAAARAAAASSLASAETEPVGGPGACINESECGEYIGETGIEIVCSAVKYATGALSAVFILSSI